MAKGTINYSDAERAIVAVLTNATAPMTLAEINAVGDTEFKTGSLVSLVKKGNIAKGETREIVCPTCGAKKSVGTYVFVTEIPVEAGTVKAK